MLSLSFSVIQHLFVLDSPYRHQRISNRNNFYKFWYWPEFPNIHQSCPPPRKRLSLSLAVNFQLINVNSIFYYTVLLDFHYYLNHHAVTITTNNSLHKITQYSNTFKMCVLFPRTVCWSKSAEFNPKMCGSLHWRIWKNQPQDTIFS